MKTIFSFILAALFFTQTADAQKIFRWDGKDKGDRLEVTLNMGLTFP